MKPFGSRVERGGDNWYKHCGVVIKKMSKVFKVPSGTLIGFVVAHMIESLLYEEKINVMDYLYSQDTIVENSVEDYAKKYFEKNKYLSNRSYSLFIGYF